VPSVSHLGPIHLGLDVHKDTISVAILAPDRDGPDVERIPHDEASVRRLVGRLGDPRWLRACYEAGPTGYELARLLERMHVRCEVIAPSLIPKAPGDKARDRPSGLPATGAAASGRGTGRHPGPDRPRRSGP
jgi:transposase